MSEDLIRRSDAIKATLTTDVNDVRLEDVTAVTDAVADAIEAIPTIEPKRGKWIDMWDQYGFEGTFKCSVCGTPWTLIDGTPQDNGMNFCPNCGCAMTKE